MRLRDAFELPAFNHSRFNITQHSLSPVALHQLCRCPLGEIPSKLKTFIFYSFICSLLLHSPKWLRQNAPVLDGGPLWCHKERSYLPQRWCNHTQLGVSRGRRLPDTWMVWQGISFSWRLQTGGQIFCISVKSKIHWTPGWQMKMWKCVCFKKKQQQQQHFSKQKNPHTRVYFVTLNQQTAPNSALAGTGTWRRFRRCLCLNRIIRSQWEQHKYGSPRLWLSSLINERGSIFLFQ